MQVDDIADKIPQLQAISHEIAACTACALHCSRTHTVAGEGAANADIMFIGEGPGQREDQLGRPFVGRSGDLLEQWLGEINLDRSQVFISNIVKCRPPNNRDPHPIEINACAHFLDRQIAIVQPKVIATVGRHAMNTFFPGARITKVHGINGVRREGDHVFIPLYHPAYVLRNERAAPDAIKDIRLIPRLIARLEQRLHEEAEQPLAELDSETSEPEQMSLL